MKNCHDCRIFKNIGIDLLILVYYCDVGNGTQPKPMGGIVHFFKGDFHDPDRRAEDSGPIVEAVIRALESPEVGQEGREKALRDLMEIVGSRRHVFGCTVVGTHGESPCNCGLFVATDYAQKHYEKEP